MHALERAIRHAVKAGIDECEIVFVEKNTTTVRITDSEIAEVKQNFDESFGIRLIHDKKISSVQATGHSKIEDSIDIAFRALPHLKPRHFWKGLPHSVSANSIDGTFDEKIENTTGSDASDIAQTMINSALDGRVSAITGSVNIVSERFHLQNTSGLEYADKATYISGIINAESEEGSKPVSGIGHNSSRTLKGFSPEKVGKEAKDMCIMSINPKRVEPGKYSVIFEPYSVGELLAFVVGQNFDLRTVSDMRSCFSGNIGNMIGTEELTLVDDPHLPEGIGSKPVDDEGTRTQKRNLIKKGIFNDTFSNIFDSCKEGTQSSGNASRPGSPMGRGSDAIPVSAPHNMKIQSGSSSQEDMISETRHGILIGRLWYTYSVNPIRGDFSCTARSGIRIIENGKITNPGKPARIIHNLPAMLKNISGIGNDMKNVMQWASLPSSTPSVKTEGIWVEPT